MSGFGRPRYQHGGECMGLCRSETVCSDVGLTKKIEQEEEERQEILKEVAEEAQARARFTLADDEEGTDG